MEEPLRAGDRVVLRYRLSEAEVAAAPDGPHLTDVVGVLTQVGADAVVVDSRRGPVTVARSAVVLAKRLPPAPPRC